MDCERLFEIHSSRLTAFSTTHKKHKKQDELGGHISGELIAYKRSKYFALLEPILNPLRRTRGEKTYHEPLFINESPDTLRILGITCSLTTPWPDMVELHPLVSPDVLFDDLRNPPDDFEFEKLDASAQQFFYEHFDPQSPSYERHLRGRNTLYWDLEDLAANLNAVVQGFVLQLRRAIAVSHVKGDRTILDSDKPFYVTGSLNTISTWKNNNLFSKLCEVPDENEHMAAFAASFTDDNNWGHEGVLKKDFPQVCLDRYLSSLKGHRIVGRSFRIEATDKEGDREAGTLVYLKPQTPSGKLLGFQDVGSGLSYIFPILTSLWASNLSFIEQPELHLHPAAQCEFGDVFISAANKGSRSVIESHSEHLLLRILRRIRDTSHSRTRRKELKLRAEDVAIYYFEPTSKSHTKVHLIRVDRYGELLDVWPGGFFAERDAELFS